MSRPVLVRVYDRAVMMVATVGLRRVTGLPRTEKRGIGRPIPPRLWVAVLIVLPITVAAVTATFVHPHPAASRPMPVSDPTPSPGLDYAVESPASASPAPVEASSGPVTGPKTAHRGRALRVPILMYHYIRVNPVASDRVGFNLSVTPSNFAAQIDYLNQLGAHTTTPAALLAALDTGAPLPPHPVLLTFDDGYQDFATSAEPVLREHGFVAVDYVVTSFIGRPGYMTRTQLVTMDRRGMIIGAHTDGHRALAPLSPDLQLSEISRSQQQLQSLLGHPVPDFAYPYGSYGATTLSILSRVGFRDAVTTNFGQTQFERSPFTWRRVRVGGADTVTSVARKALLPITFPYHPRPSTPTPTPADGPVPNPTPTPGPPSSSPSPDPMRTPPPSPTATPTATPTPTPTPRHSAAASVTPWSQTQPRLMVSEHRHDRPWAADRSDIRHRRRDQDP